jgi:hypothetical protein
MQECKFGTYKGKGEASVQMPGGTQTGWELVNSPPGNLNDLTTCKEACSATQLHVGPFQRTLAPGTLALPLIFALRFEYLHPPFYQHCELPLTILCSDISITLISFTKHWESCRPRRQP